MIRGVYSSFARCATRGKQTATGPLARRYARSRARPSLANWNVLALGSRQLISRRCLQKRSSKAFWARAPPERPPPPPPLSSHRSPGNVRDRDALFRRMRPSPCDEALHECALADAAAGRMTSPRHLRPEDVPTDVAVIPRFGVEQGMRPDGAMKVSYGRPPLARAVASPLAARASGARRRRLQRGPPKRRHGAAGTNETRRGSWRAAFSRGHGTRAPRFVRPPGDPWSSSRLTSIPRSAGSRCARTIGVSLGSSTASPGEPGVLSTSPSRSAQARAGRHLRPRLPPPRATAQSAASTTEKESVRRCGPSGHLQTPPQDSSPEVCRRPLWRRPPGGGPSRRAPPLAALGRLPPCARKAQHAARPLVRGPGDEMHPGPHLGGR